MARTSVLTPQDKDFPAWYQDVVARAELAENGPARGSMVIRPYGYSLWERMQAELDRRIKDAGAENAYFPLLIPEEFLRREAQHVAGFSPEVAMVTHGGGKELEEPLVVRPTSETIINAYFSKWVQSHRDLPLLINQWCNIVRWEMRTRLFLRTSEFLWQEGHTAHATEAEARAYALRILTDVYQDFMQEVLAVPVLAGYKTAAERFPGATNTWTCEAMMGDGKALQMGTSHELGQNFARAFEIMYSDDSGGREFVWQTSWGVSTRLMGALIMAHGDDAGLRVPPRLAPIQVVVLVVRGEDGAAEQGATLAGQLRAAGHRVHLDNRTDVSFGRRTIDWEVKGVPVRIEVGPRDLAEGNATVVRRDTMDKVPVALAGIPTHVAGLLDDIQAAMRQEAETRRRERTVAVDDLDSAIAAASSGFASLPLSVVGDDGETRLNAAGVSVRCIVDADLGLAPPEADPAGLSVVVGRAY